jgi:hypothetical protein
MGRRFGACFFGWGFFGAGAGLRVFFTGAILWKLIMLSFAFASFALDMENITAFLSPKRPFRLRPQ